MPPDNAIPDRARDNAMEFEPNWTPLENRIGDRCAEFMWMYRQDGVEFYKHIQTRRYLALDSQGRSFKLVGSGLAECDFEQRLQFVREVRYA